MTNPSELEYYADRMKNAISRMKHAIRQGEGAAYNKRIFRAMIKDFVSEGNRFIEEATGKTFMLNGSLDSLTDDIDESFEDAINAEEQAAEDARDPWLREAASADLQREAAE